MAAILVAYLLGCANAGYYLVRLRMGQDIRNTGSGATGATNAGHLLGPFGFVVVVLLDAAKGAAAVAMADATGWWQAGAAAAVVAGHVWPAQLRFRGGKGIATSLGALLVLDFRIVLLLAGLFVPLYILARRRETAGLLAYCLAPLAFPWLRPQQAVAWAEVAIVAVVLFAHRSNLICELRHWQVRLHSPGVQGEEGLRRRKWKRI